MIQTIDKVVYGSRLTEKGKIKIEVRRLEEIDGINKFLIIDWDITKNPKEAVFSTEKYYTDAELDASDALIEANNDFTGLTRREKEKKKLAIRLMMETQADLLSNGKTIYQLLTTEWEYSPNI